MIVPEFHIYINNKKIEKYNYILKEKYLTLIWCMMKLDYLLT